MGPDRPHQVKDSRCSRADQSLGLKGAALRRSRVAWPRRRAAGRPDRRRNRVAPASAPWIAAAPLAPGAGIGPPSRGASRYGSHLSTCAHTRPGRSFCIHSENAGRATGVRCRGRPHFPVSKFSRHSNCAPAVQSAAQGEHPVIGIVQHTGSAKPRGHTRWRWVERGRLSDIRRRVRLLVQWRENSREPCPQSEREVQAKRPWSAA